MINTQNFFKYYCNRTFFSNIKSFKNNLFLKYYDFLSHKIFSPFLEILTFFLKSTFLVLKYSNFSSESHNLNLTLLRVSHELNLLIQFSSFLLGLPCFYISSLCLSVEAFFWKSQIIPILGCIDHSLWY